MWALFKSVSPTCYNLNVTDQSWPSFPLSVDLAISSSRVFHLDPAWISRRLLGCRAERSPGKNHSRFSSPGIWQTLPPREYLSAAGAPSRGYYSRPIVIVVVIVAVGFAGERNRASDRRARGSHAWVVVASLPAAGARLISFRHGAIVRLAARARARIRRPRCRWRHLSSAIKRKQAAALWLMMNCKTLPYPLVCRPLSRWL